MSGIGYYTDFELRNLKLSDVSLNEFTDRDLGRIIDVHKGRIEYHTNLGFWERVADSPADAVKIAVELTNFGSDKKTNPLLTSVSWLADGLSDAFRWDPDFNANGHSAAVQSSLLLIEAAQNNLLSRIDSYPLTGGNNSGQPALYYDGEPLNDAMGFRNGMISLGQARQEYFEALAFNEVYQQKHGTSLPARMGINECFPAGTTIQLADGDSSPIENLRLGCLVVSFDGCTLNGRGGIEGKRVVRLFENITDVWLKLSNGL